MIGLKILSPRTHFYTTLKHSIHTYQMQIETKLTNRHTHIYIFWDDENSMFKYLTLQMDCIACNFRLPLLNNEIEFSSGIQMSESTWLWLIHFLSFRPTGPKKN